MGAATSGEPGCVFCDIVHQRLPAHTFYQDDEAIAFLDLYPHTRGHLLIVPRRHYERITDLPESEFHDFLQAVSNVCRRVDRLSRHYHVSMNQGTLAGQVVFHLHVHIIPRYGPENPFGSDPRKKLDDAEAREVSGILSPP